MAALPAETPLSRRVSRALRADGVRFAGPTTIHAVPQAGGMVNDHLTGSLRHAEVAALV